MKKALALILVITILSGFMTGITVVAKTGDVLNLKGTETVENLASASDAATDGKSGNTATAGNYSKGWQDGVWVATRTGTSRGSITFNSELDSTNAFANGGILEVRNKMKFDDNGAGDRFYKLHCQISVDGVQMGFESDEMNFTGVSPTIKFHPKADTSKTFCSATISENTWYTFRNIYDFNERKHSFQILDSNNVIISAGTVDFPKNLVTSNTVKFSGDLYYLDIPGKDGSTWCIDDFVINKIDYKYGDSMDARNTKFYAPLFNILSGNSDISAKKDNYYWKLDGDSAYWYAKSTAAGQWELFLPNALTTTIPTRITSFADGGEMVMQGRFKTNASSKYTMQFQLHPGGIGFKDSETAPGAEREFMAQEAGGGSYGKAVIANNAWYTFRVSYNFDTMKRNLIICDDSGKVLIDGTLDIPKDFNHSSMHVYDSAVSFVMPKGAEAWLDDFAMSKTTHKAVTVNYDETYGTVSFGGNKVVSGVKTPVAYNSVNDAIFSVVPASGYRIKDITVDGESLGNAINSHNFKNLTADKVMNVTFEEIPKVAPSVVKTAVIDTATDYNGNPAALLYVMITSPTDGSVVDNAGVFLCLESGNTEDALKLTAKDTDKTTNIVDGQFGIKVFGDALMNQKVYMTPYITYADALGNTHTTLADSEESFTLTSK